MYTFISSSDDDQFDAQRDGTIEYASGLKYVGSFVNGKPQGKGVVHRLNGDRDEGSWKGGKLHGMSKCYHPNGAISECKWTNGVKSERRFYKCNIGNIHCSWDDNPEDLLRDTIANEAEERRKETIALEASAAAAAAAAASKPIPVAAKQIKNLTCALKKCKFQHKIPENGSFNTLICCNQCRNDYYVSYFETLTSEKGVTYNIKYSPWGTFKCCQGTCTADVVKLEYMKRTDEVRAFVNFGQYGR